METERTIPGLESVSAKSVMEANRRRENKIALTGWLIVMIVATIAGFLIGFLAKN